MKPKFSLRDFFWLIVVAALAVAWWVDHQRQQAEIWRTNSKWNAERLAEENAEWIKTNAERQLRELKTHLK